MINETTSVFPLPPTIELKIDAPMDHVVSVKADYDRIKQVLMNLMENAVRYSKETGKITISVREQDHAVSIAVSDTGPGIRKGSFKGFNKFFALKQPIKLPTKGPAWVLQ